MPLGCFGHKLCRIPSNYTLRQSSEDDKKLPAVLQLEKSIVDATANLYFLRELKFKNILETIIKELETTSVQHLRGKMLNFERRFQPCKTLVERQFMTSIYDEIMRIYPLELWQYENYYVQLIIKAMENHDVGNYKSLFQTEMADYVKIFEEKFEELNEPIKEENEMFNKELNKWFEKVYNNAENDLFHKSQHIYDLIYQKFFLLNARNNYYSINQNSNVVLLNCTF